MQNGCRGAGRLAKFRDHLVLAGQVGEHAAAGAWVTAASGAWGTGHGAAGGRVTRHAAVRATRHGGHRGRGIRALPR